MRTVINGVRQMAVVVCDSVRHRADVSWVNESCRLRERVLS